MRLVDVSLDVSRAPLAGDVRLFLREADRRIQRFQKDSRIHGFVPSNFAQGYAVLQAISAEHGAPGRRFAEWGSGFGVMTCLAAMLDYEAYGIEVAWELVEAAQKLAADFDLPAEFIHGSFIPRSGEACLDAAYAQSGEGLGWLTMEAGKGAEDYGLEPEDFDIIFVYPWPDEDRLMTDLFLRCAATGAILVTFHGGDEFRVRRKVGKRRKNAKCRR